MKKNILFIILGFLVLTSGLFCGTRTTPSRGSYISYEVDPKKHDLKLYWKDDTNQPFRSIGNLKSWLDAKGRKMVFAMNAGMYKPDNTPQGLFIQAYKLVVPLDTTSGSGNFYLKPNGVFYTTKDKRAFIHTTGDFRINNEIQFATQSGPMLLIKGKIHPSFKEGSKNLNIRNGVGILPSGNVIFAMSEDEVNLYDFAKYFMDLGCQDALYLDGLVSRTYLPERQWMQTDGDFGVIVAVTESK